MPLHLSISEELKSIQFSSKWEEDGYIITSIATSSIVINELTLRTERIQQGHYETGREPVVDVRAIKRSGGELEVFENVHWCDSYIEELILNSGIGALAAKLLSVDSVRLWGTQLIYKKPKSQKNVIGWHRDYNFWKCVNSPKILTMWLAIDDMTLENGCLEYAKGSHKLGIGDNFNAAEWESSSCVMLKGQIAIHNSLTFHRSNHNYSPRPRRALAIHLLASDSFYVSGSDCDEHINVVLCGGNEGADFNNNYFPLVI